MLPRILLVLALLASFGCDSILNLFGASSSEDATLELTLHSDGYNSTDHYQEGLADLHVTLTGAVERSFTTEDFPVEPFVVPDHGQVLVEVSLLDTNGPIASGTADWALEPDISWKLHFGRAGPTNPPIVGIPPDNNPDDTIESCRRFGCRGFWRFAIDERYRNYEEESFWLVLWGFWRCPQGHVC